jgi:hypothetical protein
MTKQSAEMPVFVFRRKHDVELEADLILAGRLFIDLPREVEMTEDKQQMIGHYLRLLTDEAESGRMYTDAVIYGWRNGRKPPNAVDVNNDEVMAAWAKDCLIIEVRIDPRTSDYVLLDSDIIRQLEEMGEEKDCLGMSYEEAKRKYTEH